MKFSLADPSQTSDRPEWVPTTPRAELKETEVDEVQTTKLEEDEETQVFPQEIEEEKD